MDGARHFHFALDIEQTLTARKRARRDTHRKAKPVITQVHLRQAIDLTCFFARQGIQTITIANRFLQKLVRVVMAALTRQQSRFNIGHLNLLTAACQAHGGTLHLQRLRVGKNGALAYLVFHFAVRLLQQTHYRGVAEVRQAQTLAGVTD